MDLSEAYRSIVEAETKVKEAPLKEADEPNPKAKEILRRRTKVIINPPLQEGSFDPVRDKDESLKTDPSIAVSDPYKTIGDNKASIELKDLAFKLIRARQFD